MDSCKRARTLRMTSVDTASTSRTTMTSICHTALQSAIASFPLAQECRYVVRKLIFPIPLLFLVLILELRYKTNTFQPEIHPSGRKVSGRRDALAAPFRLPSSAFRLAFPKIPRPVHRGGVGQARARRLRVIEIG